MKPFELITLPFAPEVLEPVISRETIALHHGKHLQTYVNNLNNLLPGSGLEDLSLEEIVKEAFLIMPDRFLTTTFTSWLSEHLKLTMCLKGHWPRPSINSLVPSMNSRKSLRKRVLRSLVRAGFGSQRIKTGS